MNQVNLFIELTRLKKPIGYMLLFWPCAWGLTLAYDFSKNLNNYFFYLLLFFLGSVLMRSAGCIVNDILDKEFDAKVFRTKERPIASGKISIKLGIIYSLLLCFLAFLILINFNYFTIFLALGSMPLAFTYPLMKRLTYWPQLFLGITFNYGLVLGWTAVTGEIDLIAIVFYIGAIFWTLGYDTIYGFQDIKDDEIIGLKSTSIKFKKKPYNLLFSCYSIFLLSLLITGYFMELNKISLLVFFLLLIQMFYFQLKKLNIDDPSSCLRIFKSNNYLGLIIFFGILIGKF
ncbi:4-hydroxybenzoate octaprenyltransferase [Candidatus Pelagibacter sp.]|nr:4-hydroxybenzoate octaprenyltransferase [Candidatus Pelagibacter sp.]